MHITFYTDGAAKNNGGPGRIGYAALAIVNGAQRASAARSFEWSGGEDSLKASNQKAELLGMRLALQRVKPELRAGSEIVLYSDSKWALSGVLGYNYDRGPGTSWKVKTHVDLIQEIRDLLRQFGSWQLEYTPAHVGEELNERANELAQRQAGTWAGAS